MTRFWGLTCLILGCTAASGQTVTISGPSGTYTSTSILASGGPITLQSPWSGPAGTYTIQLPANATVSQSPNGVTITWGNGPTPQPPLPPPPGPTPLLPVTPLSATLSVVCVFDRAGPAVPATQSALQTSTTIADALRPLNATLVCVDVTTKTMQGWIKDARAAGIPALLVMVMGPNNKAVNFEAIPLPIDGEIGVIAEIKRIRGLGGNGVSPSPQMTRVVELLTEIKTTLGRRK